MEQEITEDIEVRVESYYLDEHSSPEQEHYVYAYHIKIKNLGGFRVQLISRHWVITDGNGEVTEVRGEGVVGEQPLLEPNEEFEYTSGSHLKTRVGTMSGSYQMSTDEGRLFKVTIPCFTLEVPGVLN